MFGRRQTASVSPLTGAKPPAQAPSNDSAPVAKPSPRSPKPVLADPFKDDVPLEVAVERVLPPVRKAIEPGAALKASRGELAKQVREIVDEMCKSGVLTLEEEANLRVSTACQQT